MCRGEHHGHPGTTDRALWIQCACTGLVTLGAANEFAAITSVAKQLSIGSAETSRKWVRQAEVDAGKRPGTTREEAAEVRALKRRMAELERANEILKAASSYFARELDFKL